MKKYSKPEARTQKYSENLQPQNQARVIYYLKRNVEPKPGY